MSEVDAQSQYVTTNNQFYGSTDHFNYPAQNRKDTMYLSTIRPAESGFRKVKIERDSVGSLMTQDIDKARPHYQGYQYTNKESFNNRNDDIGGSHPRKLHQPLEKQYFNMKTDDIKGAKPQSHKFETMRQPTNPLNPEYKLPYAEVRVSTPPKFIRDNIDIKDIEGSRPNPYMKFSVERKTLFVDDIDGARPKKEWIPEGKPSTLNVKDINAFLEFHTTRNVNPLSPRYMVQDENNNKFLYGDVDNKGHRRHPIDPHREISYDLRTTDVFGAQADTSTAHLRRLSPRRNNLTEDIQGAQAATLHKGITTGRNVNPIVPKYQNPGHSEPAPVYDRNAKPISKSTVNIRTRTVKSEDKVKEASPVVAVAPRIVEETGPYNIINHEKPRTEIKRPHVQISEPKKEGDLVETRSKTFIQAAEKSLNSINLLKKERDRKDNVSKTSTIDSAFVSGKVDYTSEKLTKAQKLDKFIS
jgi:hypothetical protein